MKATILAVALLVFSGVVSIADGAITLLPWTSTEIDKFAQHNDAVWVGNTLTLTFEGANNNSPHSSTDGGDGTANEITGSSDIYFILPLLFLRHVLLLHWLQQQIEVCPLVLGHNHR